MSLKNVLKIVNHDEVNIYFTKKWNEMYIELKSKTMPGDFSL